MQFKTDFKNTIDKAQYLAKLVKLLPNEGCNEGYRDVGSYQIKYHERKINVYHGEGEEMEIAWGAGVVSPWWDFILTQLLTDVEKEITDNVEILSALGLIGKGLNFK